MSIATMTLGGHNLPSASGYSVAVEYRGGVAIMANGAPIVDLVSTSLKHKFTIRWIHLSKANRDAVETAYDHVSNTSASFVDPDNNSWTVTRDPVSSVGIQWETIRLRGQNLAYSGELVLREV